MAKNHFSKMSFNLPNDPEVVREIKKMNEKRYGKFAEVAPDSHDFDDPKTGYTLSAPIFYYHDELRDYDDDYYDEKKYWHIIYVKINYKSWHFTMKCYSTSCVLDIWNRAEEIMGIGDTIGVRYEVFQNPVSPFDALEELDIADENRITIDVCDDEDLW